LNLKTSFPIVECLTHVGLTSLLDESEQKDSAYHQLELTTVDRFITNS